MIAIKTRSDAMRSTFLAPRSFAVAVTVAVICVSAFGSEASASGAAWVDHPPVGMTDCRDLPGTGLQVVAERLGAGRGPDAVTANPGRHGTRVVEAHFQLRLPGWQSHELPRWVAHLDSSPWNQHGTVYARWSLSGLREAHDVPRAWANESLRLSYQDGKLHTLGKHGDRLLAAWRTDHAGRATVAFGIDAAGVLHAFHARGWIDDPFLPEHRITGDQGFHDARRHEPQLVWRESLEITPTDNMLELKFITVQPAATPLPVAALGTLHRLYMAKHCAGR